ncbi:MAG TPA: hypothetical protein VGH99_21150 [Pseudonocardia sp.]|jgi:hypothetical protein
MQPFHALPPALAVPAQRAAGDGGDDQSRSVSEPEGDQRVADVPGAYGVAAPAAEPFELCGHRWVVADADGTPIGYALAREQATGETEPESPDGSRTGPRHRLAIDPRPRIDPQPSAAG